MKHPLKPTARRYERGVVAIEAALVLPILLVFLSFPSLFAAFYYRQYSAAQKAVHDAALYLSTAPRTEMITTGPDGAPAALSVAKTIMEKEMAGIVPSGTSLNAGIGCIYQVGAGTQVKPCLVGYNQSANDTLIRMDVTVYLTFVNPLTGNDSGLRMEPHTVVPYVGN